MDWELIGPIREGSPGYRGTKKVTIEDSRDKDGESEDTNLPAARLNSATPIQHVSRMNAIQLKTMTHSCQSSYNELLIFPHIWSSLTLSESHIPYFHPFSLCSFIHFCGGVDKWLRNRRISSFHDFAAFKLRSIDLTDFKIKVRINHLYR